MTRQSSQNCVGTCPWLSGFHPFRSLLFQNSLLYQPDLLLRQGISHWPHPVRWQLRTPNAAPRDLTCSLARGSPSAWHGAVRWRIWRLWPFVALSDAGYAAEGAPAASHSVLWKAIFLTHGLLTIWCHRGSSVQWSSGYLRCPLSKYATVACSA